MHRPIVGFFARSLTVCHSIAHITALAHTGERSVIVGTGAELPVAVVGTSRALVDIWMVNCKQMNIDLWKECTILMIQRPVQQILQSAAHCAQSAISSITWIEKKGNLKLINEQGVRLARFFNSEPEAFAPRCSKINGGGCRISMSPGFGGFQ